MKTSDLNKALENFANQDLATARKEGGHFITDTKKGTLELKYRNRRYSIIDPKDGWCWVVGSAAKARAFLVENYQVEIA